MFVMGNVCADIEFELNCWKFWVIFREVALCLIEVLGLFGLS